MAEDKNVRRIRLKLEKLLESNKNEIAATLLAELCELEPRNARWPHKRGDLLRKLGRDKEAVLCYASAVDIYADQGFIARAVAMAKTVLNLDASRIDILERVDPNAAQQLRQQQRAQQEASTKATKAAQPHHPMVVEEVLSGATTAQRHLRVRDGEAASAVASPRAGVVPPPLAPKRHPMVLDDDAETEPLAAPVPAPQAAPPPLPNAARAPRQLRKRPITLDHLALPPPVSSLEAPKPGELSLAAPRVPDAEEIYGRALHGVPELEVDPRAAPNETRFSNAPPRRGDSIEIEISLDELEPREAVPVLESLHTEPPTADKLSKLPLFPLFAEVPKEALSEMIAEAELIELAHGDYVIRKGDAGDALYGIVEGSVAVVVPGQQVQLTLAEGDVFGESCLLQDEKRHADVVVQGKLVALRIPRDVLTRLLGRHPKLAEVLLEMLTRRLLGNLLQSSSLFAEFDAAGRRELSRLFEIRRAPAGTVLAAAGKRMDGLYISLTGTLAVRQDGGPERIAPPGSMFGQHTLLSNEPSQVDVKTRVNMVVLRLPAMAFTQVAMQYPTILARLSELSTSEVVKVTL